MVVLAESSLEWIGLLHGLEGVEGVAGMDGAGLRVVAECGGEDASNRISAAGVVAADGTSGA